MDLSKDPSHNPLISVLMTAYNSQEYIAGTIESILNQTYTNFEFLIIDDASTDSTWSIIREYAGRDPRINASRNEKNLGIPASRNRLVRRAQGNFIAWQDADDVSLAPRLFEQTRFLTENPEVGIIGGQIKFIDLAGRIFMKHYPTNDAEIRKNIFRYNPISQSASMIRKSCFNEVGLYNEAYPLSSDLDLFFRIGQRFKFANLNDAVLVYRQHPLSSTYSRISLTEKIGCAIRDSYKKDDRYSFGLTDRLYSGLYSISPYLIPRKLKIFLFNKWRNSKE